MGPVSYFSLICDFVVNDMTWLIKARNCSTSLQLHTYEHNTPSFYSYHTGKPVLPRTSG